MAASRAARVHDCGQRLVVDLDQLGCVARKLARGRDHSSHGVADEARAPDGQRVVLELTTRGRRDLEERLGEDRDLVARERAQHAGRLERRADVDREDARVGIGRAHEMDEAHVVALHVVDEHALALDEAAVLLAGNALPDERALLGALGSDAAHLADTSCAAACTASMMFQ